MRRERAAASLMLLFPVCWMISPVKGGELPAAQPKTRPDMIVLDLERGSFVAYARWKTPSVVTRDGQVVPLIEAARKNLEEKDRRPWPVVAADPPAQDWALSSFDDSRWVRARSPVLVPQSTWGYGHLGAIGMGIYFPGNQVEWGLVCLRGKFRVEDPAGGKDLKLALRYHGGVVVHVNGQELCRSHMPKGRLEFDTLADRYAEEAYVRPDGRLYGPSDEKAFAERMKVRVRNLGSPSAPGDSDGVPIPAAMLRKGINVIAIEAHAAPLGEPFLGHAPGERETPWPHVGVLDARLTAAPGASPGVVPCVAPGEGVELWTAQPLETVETWDYAHPVDQIRPIRLVGARNGTFSGRVVLGSKTTIRDLRAAVSDLVQNGAAGKIAASAVQVRWAEPANPAVSWRNPQYCSNHFDRLLPAMPAEVVAHKVSLGYGVRFQPAEAAAVPIWVSVRVPANAAPGDYRGTLTVEARGATAAAVRFVVPIELKVHDWKIPDPRDFTVHHNIYQSPDTVARYYQVPLWSDKHFELLGKSLDVLGQVANKLCAVHLVAMSSAVNNSESMVRWIKKPDGSFDHDFSIMERYLDLYAVQLGKPGILQINVWMNPRDEPPSSPLPGVTVFDPATGKTELLRQPPYGTPENEAFWKPVMMELRKRLEKRGWFDVAAVVNATKGWPPSRELVSTYRHIWPDGKWMNASHGNPDRFEGKTKDDAMPVPYSEFVWGGRLYNPETDKAGQYQHASLFHGEGDRGRGPSHYAFYPRAWKAGAKRIEASIPRTGSSIVDQIRDDSALVIYRMITEAALQGNRCGIGRVGGDFWPLPTGKEGKFQPLCTDHGGCSMPTNVLALASPGPDGAIFNERLEMFREGVQVAEAIIAVQRALEANRIDGDLAVRAENLLDERARYYLRACLPYATNRLSLECSNWQERDSRLFALAAEISKATR